MPKMTRTSAGCGLVAAAEMRAWRSSVAVIMLAPDLNEEDFLKAMAVGAIVLLVAMADDFVLLIRRGALAAPKGDEMKRME